MRLRRRKRRRASPGVIAAALASLGAASAAGVVAWRRRAAGGEQSFKCDCGQRYIVRGVDRHRVYWLPEDPKAEPVLGRDCVACGEPLPATHDGAINSRGMAPR